MGHAVVRRLGLLAALLVVMAVHDDAATDPFPLFPPISTDHRVDWFGPGLVARGVVPSPSVLRFLDFRHRLAELDSALLRSHLRESLDSELDPIFADVNGRAPALAAWAFRWRTSYALLRRGVVAAALAGPQGNSIHAWNAETAAVVREKFDDLVLHGEETAWHLNRVRQRWFSLARETVDGVFTDHDQANAAFVMRWAAVTPATVMADETAPAAFPPAPLDGIAPLRGKTVPEEERIEGLRWRAARPVAARVIIRLPRVLPVVAVSDAAAAASSLAPVGGVAGAAVSLASTLAFDFLLSRADALANQDQWENEVRQGLETWRQSLRSQWLAEMDDYIEARRRQTVASLHAEPLRACCD